MIELHDSVILGRNLPEDGLFRGDIGVVVDIHNGGEAYEVEFMTLTGSTVAVRTLEADDVQPVSSGMIPHVREPVG